MQPIIYDVAVSLDGYISGPDGDITQFAHEGPVVEDYIARLGDYATAVMGRKTYEFGYAYGLEPGQNPYSHMDTFVFSGTLELPSRSDISVVSDNWLETLGSLRSTSKGPIYLCGGGVFAGWMLRTGLIDRVLLKRAPVSLGGGVRLFGDSPLSKTFKRVSMETYENGYLLEELVCGE